MKTHILLFLIHLGIFSGLLHAQSPCDSVIIESVHFDPLFSDSNIIAMVDNQSTNFFSGPLFKIVDANSDTLAVEVANFFGLSGQSRHSLTIESPLSGTTLANAQLLLYTYFDDSLACSFPLDVDLCLDTCIEMSASVQMTGLDSASYDFSYTIQDSANQEVANGQLTVDTANYFASNTICLAPGSYSAAFTQTGGTGSGTIYCRIYTPLGNAGELQVYTANLEYDFEVMTECIVAAPNGLVETGTRTHLNYRMNGNTMILENDEGIIEHLEIMDLQGRVIHHSQPNLRLVEVNLGSRASSVYLVRAQTNGEVTHLKVLTSR